MASSNKAFFWGLFAAGGTISAISLPILMSITLAIGLGATPPNLSYELIHAFISHWFIKLALFTIISLSLWHFAHRARTALYGLGLRADRLIAITGYSIATLGSVASLYYLFQI